MIELIVLSQTQEHRKLISCQCVATELLLLYKVMDEAEDGLFLIISEFRSRTGSYIIKVLCMCVCVCVCLEFTNLEVLESLLE